jgi:hypothetical protein
MCLWQIVAAVLLLAVCAQTYPIQVQNDVQYEVPDYKEQLSQYVPEVQYSDEPEQHEVEVHHNVSASSGEK